MKARCMLNSTDLGHKVWPYAYMYAAYVYNRSYVHRIDNTPYSLIYKRKSNISQLHKFGETMYAHKDKFQCNMEPRSEKGNFLGFNPHAGGQSSTEKMVIYLQRT